MICHKTGRIQIHIPKTGGISIRRAIFRKLKTDRYMHINPLHPRVKKYWDSYFTFTFVRNPFDRLLSIYSFTMDLKNPLSKNNKPFIQTMREKNMTFEEFVYTLYKSKSMRFFQRFKPQIHWLQPEGQNIKFDFIGRLESIQNDYMKLCDLLQIKEPLPLPNANKSTNRDIKYKKYYTPEMQKMVSELYNKDFKFLKYKF